MKPIILLVVMPIMAFSMDLNNNNNNNLSTDWPIALQKSTSSPQERLAYLTIEQKIAQLFMPGMQLNDPSDFEKVTKLIEKYPIGGVLLTHPNTSDMAVMYIQSLHDNNISQGYPLPLWIAMDAEWGPSMRLTDAVVFPKSMTLAATNNKELIYECAKEIGSQLEKLGVHINFAPVVDVNNNSNNPVIGMRSFGEDPERVIECAKAYMSGLRKNKILFSLKHYPGHGDTEKDSHKELPEIKHSLERLHTLELKPFKELIGKEIVPMVMIAHLLVPALDKELPTSLSPLVIEGLLRKELGFKELVITDGLKMDAVSKKYPSAELAILAFKAGHDIILQLDDTAAGIEALIAAYKKGEITQQQIDEHFMRIWCAKNQQGLLEKEDLRPQDYDQNLFHTLYAYDLQQRLYEAAMTLVNNDNRTLPISSSAMKETLFIDIGGAAYFAKELEQQGVVVKRLSRIFNREEVVKNLWGNFNNIIISIADMNKSADQSYGISQDTQYLCKYVQRLKDLQSANLITINENSVFQDMVVQKENEKIKAIYESPKRTAIVLFGMPYAASLLEHQDLLIAYEDNQAAQVAAAKVVLGKHKPTGKLPVSISTHYPAGTGLSF